MRGKYRSPQLVLTFGTLFLSAGLYALAQQKEFSNWPEGTSPQVIGKRVAENFIVRPYRAQSDPTKKSIGIIYPEVCTWYGALTVAQLTGDKELQSRLVKNIDQDANVANVCAGAN